MRAAHRCLSSPRLLQHRRATEAEQSTSTSTLAKARRFKCGLGIALIAASAALAACGSANVPSDAVSPVAEWHEFHGIWTATGRRHAISLGGERRASIASYTGSLLLAGGSRPGVGFRAEAIVLNDSTTGMVGRAVWTDERGDEVYSELKGEASATSNRIVGSFLGGTGRYAGAQGTYEFSWRFLLEAEDGTVQGQSLGLAGRVHLGATPTKPGIDGPRS